MEYLIFDLERYMLWKKNKCGYTLDIEDALVVTSREDLQKYVDADLNGRTIGVTKESYLHVMERKRVAKEYREEYNGDR